MALARRAVIDVGTNSVKLLVADVTGHEVHPLWEDSRQTRLGSGFYEARRLQAGPISHTADAVAAFADTARERKVDSIRVIATSAARDAINAQELINAIETTSHLKVEIISGDQEAEWVFQGVTTDVKLARQPLLLMDVGGGSTEFIVGQGEHKHFRASFSLGTVRLLEAMPPADPPRPEDLTACREWIRNFLATEVHPKIEPALQRELASGSFSGLVQLVGTGGTTTILARMEAGMEDYDRQRIEATRLNQDRVNWHLKRLWSVPLSQRREIIGLPRDRADVVLTGVAIYAAVMEDLGFSELHVSTRGLRFAAVMDAT